jgi:hypothetical protein
MRLALNLRGCGIKIVIKTTSLLEKALITKDKFGWARKKG